MLLSDQDIRVELDRGELQISPLDFGLLQPASYDIRLGQSFRVFENHQATAVDPLAPPADLTKEIKIRTDAAFVLHPGEFVLGTTWESVMLPNHIAAMLEGKSSRGRVGLVIHATAGYIDPGFYGEITLELSNVSRLPIILRPRMTIGQLAFVYMSSPVVRPYGSPGLGSRYQHQTGATEARG